MQPARYRPTGGEGIVGWSKVHWLIIRQHLLDPGDVLLMAGDEVVVTKSGNKT
ncbi:MAG: hypothetical protein WA970_23990 [Gammaproteobacteria bacterium]